MHSFTLTLTMHQKDHSQVSLLCGVCAEAHMVFDALLL